MPDKNATYEIVSNPIGADYARTTLTWMHKYADGAAKERTTTAKFTDRSRFKAWCKKYNVEVPEEDLNRIPKSR